MRRFGRFLAEVFGTFQCMLRMVFYVYILLRILYQPTCLTLQSCWGDMAVGYCLPILLCEVALTVGGSAQRGEVGLSVSEMGTHVPKAS
ncbi:hypothetical protein BDZ89DRAFT_390302 [Hymenopellis radicata]|nr:hypothetical protein BDZ89DRAFT_390302 [Hymenopellis radicata]